jgi:putative methyltransferase (TIGR04325 family)
MSLATAPSELPLAARAARVWQIKATAALLNRLSHSQIGGNITRGLHASPAAAQALLGYRATFPTLAAAEQAVAPYANGGHLHPLAAERHLRFADVARPSDYPAMFHLRPLLPELHSVADLGGNIGNLFYCYSRYLAFPNDMEWSVIDLPDYRDRGAALARERAATQLRFTHDREVADGADLLIASGSLHYFPQSLPHMLRGFTTLPRHVLINRTPLTDGPQVATIQDAGHFRVACMLYNRAALLADFAALGYRIVDSWPAGELSLAVPGDPSHSISAYSGYFLTRDAR